MVIFINDIPVRILKDSEQPTAGRVNHVVDAAVEPVTQAKLIHHVWIKNVNERVMATLIEFLDSKVPTNVLSVLLTVNDLEAIKTFLKSRFKVVKAAGGIVRKKDKVLMIYRMKKWDLPKGKKEKGERYKETAVREIEEECNVNVKIGKKVCTTWHTYTMNKRAMIKKTRWFMMDVLDNSRLRPAAEEDIEEVRWMNQKEVYHALEHSYKSISYVIEQYHQLIAAKTTK